MNKKSDIKTSEYGRFVFTTSELVLIEKLQQAQKDGIIKYSIIPQFWADKGGLIDFAIPQLKLGIEVDGEIFNSNPKQQKHNMNRDMKLAKCGWTILRFMDTEIKKNLKQVMSTIIKEISKNVQKENKMKKSQSRNSLGQFIKAKKAVGAKVQCLVTTKAQDKILKPILKQMSKAK